MTYLRHCASRVGTGERPLGQKAPSSNLAVSNGRAREYKRVRGGDGRHAASMSFALWRWTRANSTIFFLSRRAPLSLPSQIQRQAKNTSVSGGWALQARRWTLSGRWVAHCVWPLLGLLVNSKEQDGGSNPLLYVRPEHRAPQTAIDAKTRKWIWIDANCPLPPLNASH